MSVVLDGTVSAVRSTACHMVMPHMDITRASLGQEEKFVCKTGMD